MKENVTVETWKRCQRSLRTCRQQLRKGNSKQSHKETKGVFRYIWSKKVKNISPAYESDESEWNATSKKILLYIHYREHGACLRGWRYTEWNQYIGEH